jgi:hypothetical protein
VVQGRLGLLQHAAHFRKLALRSGVQLQLALVVLMRQPGRVLELGDLSGYRRTLDLELVALLLHQGQRLLQLAHLLGRLGASRAQLLAGILGLLQETLGVRPVVLEVLLGGLQLFTHATNLGGLLGLSGGDLGTQLLQSALVDCADLAELLRVYLRAGQLLPERLDLSLRALQRQLLGGVVVGHRSLDDLRALGLGEALLGEGKLALQQVAAVLRGLGGELRAGKFLGDAG